MGPLGELLLSVVKSYPGMFLNPVLVVVYLIVLVLVAVQYGKIQSIEERVYGKAKNKAVYQTALSIGYGLFGGLLVSILLVLVGVSVNDAGLGYLLPIALALFLFSPRFLCFSYSGALVSLSYLVFGWPEVNVAAMMALVACLHAAEALLIRLSGMSCATPLYLAGGERGVLGGFSLQRFWPIPLIALTVVRVPDVTGMEGLIHLPDWWPLIAAAKAPGAGVPIFAMVPLVAALGYGDISLAKAPREKAKSTSRALGFFSLLLLLFSMAASRWSGFAWAAALFAPIAHEVVIRVGAREEMAGPPHYREVPDGVMVLDVIEGSPAEKARIKSGDVILSVRDVPVRTREDLQMHLKEPGNARIVVRDYGGIAVRETVISREEEPIGVITVPQLGDQPIASAGSAGPLGNLFKGLFNRLMG